MIGPLTIGRKAAKYGYKRYGVPGAIVAGVGGVGGYVFVKRKLSGASSTEGGDGDDGSGTFDASDDGTESAEETADADGNSDDDDSDDGDSDDDSE